MTWFWNRPHKHFWVERDQFQIVKENKALLGVVISYRCYRCGALRYDKLDATGFVSSTVTDDKESAAGAKFNSDTVQASRER